MQTIDVVKISNLTLFLIGLGQVLLDCFLCKSIRDVRKQQNLVLFTQNLKQKGILSSKMKNFGHESHNMAHNSW